MSDETDPESKTEEPTEKKLHDAAERGDTPISREVSLSAALAAFLIVTANMIPQRSAALMPILGHFIDDPAGWRLESSDAAIALIRNLIVNCAQMVGPVVLVIMVFGVLASAAQQSPRFVPDRIMPDASRIALRKGAARIFGPRGWTEFGKSLFKLGIVAVVLALTFRANMDLILEAMATEITDLPRRMLYLSVRMIAAALVATLAIAAGDLVWTRILWRRDHRMSREEVKEELRQLEGDRMMKARLRSIRLDRSRKRMLAAVPKATMVVVNPTHYAVALRYVRDEGGAPMVLAKGTDLIALKIREIATGERIPIVEDKPLARSLYNAVTVDHAIPPEFYRAIAELVHILSTRKSTWPLVRNRESI